MHVLHDNSAAHCCGRTAEEVDEPIDDGVDVQHWLPLVAQDVKAHLPLEVDVGVVDFCKAQHLRCFVGVRGRHLRHGGVARRDDGGGHRRVRVQVGETCRGACEGVLQHTLPSHAR